MDTTHLAGWADRVYGLLLWAYPATFRRKYGGEMRALFRACCRDAAAEGGMAWMGMCVAALGDLAKNALLERWSGARHDEECAAMTSEASGRTIRAWQGGVGGEAFGRRLTEVLAQNPVYTDALVSGEPPRRLLDVVDSMALDADPGWPDAAVMLFEQLCQDLPAEESDALARQLSDSMWRAGAQEIAADEWTLPGKLLRRVYADPALFGLLAGAGSDTELAGLLEYLALDAQADEVDAALGLVRELSAV